MSRAPEVGQIVLYETDARSGRRYYLPAIITCTVDSHPGVEEIPVLNGTQVHLYVLAPTSAFHETAVPYDGRINPETRTWKFKEDLDD